MLCVAGHVIVLTGFSLGFVYVVALSQGSWLFLLSISCLSKYENTFTMAVHIFKFLPAYIVITI